MGHTHYWSFVSKRGDAIKNEKAYQKGIKECSKVILYYSKTFGGLSGYSSHTDKYGGITVNGSERVGSCEPLVFREHLNQNESFNFCKTRQYPYDTVITACLIIMQHRLGKTIEVSSDGRSDDWNDGLILVQKVLGLKKIRIPIGVRTNNYEHTQSQNETR